MSTTTRTRRPHTRSKTGCLTCRKRRVRCDGGKPTCARCSSAGRECEFADAELPLRDRKAVFLPGEQAPWIVASDNPVTLVTKSPFAKSVEPFDCLGLDMSLRSRELLHYFHHSHDSSDLILTKASRNIFSSVAQHPDALRDTLLVAGLHYAWTVGDLQTYKSTFLFHKVSTIGILNRWLQNISQPGLMTFIRHVSILCFIEASYGNVGDTEAHVNGLINAVHLLSPLDDDFGNRTSLDEELANRYLLLTHYAYQGFKARILGSDSLKNMFRQNNTADFSTFVSLIHLWKTQNVGHLEMRLNAMKLLPFFFAVLPSSTQFHNIDASPLLEHLKHVTMSTQTASEDRYKCDPSWEWIEGSESRLLCATINSHFSSMFEDDMFSSPSRAKYSISWSGMCAASSLYMHNVLELWDGGEPMNSGLLRRFLCIIKKDLEQTLDTLGSSDTSDFWLWRAFLGMYSITKHQACVHDPTLDDVADVYHGFVETWKMVTGITLWEDVHQRLISVAWPDRQGCELEPSVWGRSLEYEPELSDMWLFAE